MGSQHIGYGMKSKASLDSRQLRFTIGPFMAKISFKGVIIGAITDILSTNILAIPFLLFVISTHGLLNTPKEQVNAQFLRAVHGSVLLFSIQVLIGCGCSALGGYVAARIAKHDELLNASLSSFLCVAIGAYALITGKVSMGQFMLAPVSVLCALAGGYLRRLKRTSETSTQMA